ncbi:chaperonin-like RbcX protein 2, chloroplastic [Phragmites australis]|uniref:chaperonin-like RbcX protein 2, chloroplastic n=1 Tax=Phragmites australis TaxID=29695 RepID=UPI002D7973B7|nr:chaperonin-like RbcX protein 2, chloroplastic [Phragmites australis]
MVGVQMMPAVGAVAAVDVRAEGSMAGLRTRRVAVSGASLFAGDWRRRPRRPACSVRVHRQGRSRGGLAIVCNLAGQYEDSFEDVQLQLMNYFTYKAVRTVLTQLYEMNPPSYRWFYNFVAVNKPTDGKLFLRALSKERQELAERVMITRLHLYGKWIKKCDHGKMYEKISDENLMLMRERLMETVIWPTDDTNTTEKIG